MRKVFSESIWGISIDQAVQFLFATLTPHVFLQHGSADVSSRSLQGVEQERLENAKKTGGNKGLVGMSGRDLFTYVAWQKSSNFSTEWMGRWDRFWFKHPKWCSIGMNTTYLIYEYCLIIMDDIVFEKTVKFNLVWFLDWRFFWSWRCKKNRCGISKAEAKSYPFRSQDMLRPFRFRSSIGRYIEVDQSSFVASDVWFSFKHLYDCDHHNNSTFVMLMLLVSPCLFWWIESIVQHCTIE